MRRGSFARAMRNMLMATREGSVRRSGRTQVSLRAVSAAFYLGETYRNGGCSGILTKEWIAAQTKICLTTSPKFVYGGKISASATVLLRKRHASTHKQAFRDRN